MITSARLQHVRLYDDQSFEFDDTVNIIIGQNASGKTTLLESLLVALQGKSFKAKDQELVQFDQPWARIDILLSDSERVCKLVVEQEKTVKTFEVDDQTIMRLSAQKKIPTVLFEPNDLLLLHGSPERRRNFLDDLIGQMQPGYESVRRHYKRVLAQRNALLKKSGQNLRNDQLFVWNLRLSELAGKMVAERVQLLEQFNVNISKYYSEVAGATSTIELQYDTALPIATYETTLLKTLEKNIDRDKLLGFTSAGPHREDFQVIMNSQNASQAASRGEIRTLVLVLKMLEASFIEQVQQKKPILLFDDVFSELDGRRRQALVQFLKPYQSFITTTDADLVLDHFTKTTRVITTQ
jgi:DNA replication and repair protein RecF